MASMWKCVVIGTLVVLAGCSSYKPKTIEQIRAERAAEPKKQAAVCTTKPQCDAMWLAAKKYIQQETTLRLQHDSDDLIQTYNPRTMPGMYGEAERRPNPDGSYSIAGKFTCRIARYCKPSHVQSAAFQFNLEMQLVGDKFGKVKMVDQ